ncbi:MAG: hypothetical protein V4472_25660 [Pseudomonadota bacterium]
MGLASRRVAVAFRSDWRDYLPVLRWDWYESDEGCLSLSIGNRGSDDLFGIDVTVRRIPAWLGGTPQEGVKAHVHFS